MVKVLIAGGSGFIGNALSDLLQSNGYEVLVLSRKRGKKGFQFWDPKKGELSQTAFDGVEIVINLAGEGITSRRWTKDYKKKLVDSRVLSTRLLAKSIDEFGTSVKLFISGSAVGYYPSSEDEILEESGPGDNFLSGLAVEWENASKTQRAVRKIIIRLGIVVGEGGGMYDTINAMGKKGIWPRFLPNNAYFPAISLEDTIRSILFGIENQAMEGPLNLVSPERISLDETVRQIKKRAGGKGLHMPVPKSLLRIMEGEGIDSLFEPQNIIPQKLLNAGFKFKKPNLI